VGYYGGQPSEPFDGQLTSDLRIYKLVPTIFLDAKGQLGGPESKIAFRNWSEEMARITRLTPLSGRRLEINDKDRMVLSINDMPWLDLDPDAGYARLYPGLRVEGLLDIWLIGLGTRFAVDPDGTIRMPNLPTNDPGIAGALWNHSGKVEIPEG